MEVAGVVCRQPPCFSSTTADASNSLHFHSFPTMRKPSSFRVKQPNRNPFLALAVSDEFSDKSHLQYYNSPRMAVKEKDDIASKKKEMKKKLKLLKGLSKNLSTFSDMGFGLNLDNSLDQQVKSQMISEATETLLAQLQKLKSEKMEFKKMKKEEKIKKKAARMMTECKDSSSSESSSSESDCENVVNMKQLKTELLTAPTTIIHEEEKSSVEILENRLSEAAICKDAICKDVMVSSECGKKIEVCMGGKCKKSGGAMLMENLEKAVDGGATVVGCKCMGKCREGPNVRVGDNSVLTGVGIEDVDLIVSNFFGGSGSQRSPALASV